MHIKSGTCVSLIAAFLALAQVVARPTRRLLENIDITNDVLLFDAPAFQDPQDPASFKAVIPAFVSLRQPGSNPTIADGFNSALGASGVQVGNRLQNLKSRVTLFGAVGIPGKQVNLKVDGCGSEVTIGKTSGFPNLGMMLQTADLTACPGAQIAGQKAVAASVELSNFDSRNFAATIFPSPPGGIGIISDIDDTIKISNVLDKPKLLQATFLDDPQPVSGMPQLYSKLQKGLKVSPFFYVTGSPFQLYPFLRGFVQANYPPGPILPKNLTFLDVPGVINALSQNGTQEFKLKMIDRINGIFPKKQFLMIGDSTERDPETYGQAFRTHGGRFVKCIWIRKVDGANNDQTRFDAAFQGVAQGRTRLFTDPSELESIDVKGGKC